MQTFDELEGIEVIMPIVSLDLLHFDKSNSKNITTYNSFNNYIDLNFGKNETKKKQTRNYSVQILAQNSNSIKFDKNILVFRVDMKNISELFVTLSDPTYDLRVSYLNEENHEHTQMYCTTMLLKYLYYILCILYIYI